MRKLIFIVAILIVITQTFLGCKKIERPPSERVKPKYFIVHYTDNQEVNNFFTTSDFHIGLDNGVLNFEDEAGKEFYIHDHYLVVVNPDEQLKQKLLKAER